MVEEEVAILARIFKMNIGVDVGYYNIDEERAPCSPLAGTSMNVDYRGRLSLCCNLSGFRGAAEETDVVADLNVESFCVGVCEVQGRRVGAVEKNERTRFRVARQGVTPMFTPARRVCFVCKATARSRGQRNAD